MKQRLVITIFLVSLLVFPISDAQARSNSPVVCAVLFYSPTCGHCHYVMTEVLPPLFDRHGNQLQMVGVDISSPDGQTLFLSALAYYNIEQAGVPLLIVGNQVLIGSREIPDRFPGLIEAYLSQGGVDWPPIPGLVVSMSASPTPEATVPAGVPMTSTPNTTTASWKTNFSHDPLGNSLAVIVLAGMVTMIGNAAIYLRRKPMSPSNTRWNWLTPLLCTIGLGIAGYLSHVEVAQVEAVCGPIGDCNAVQQSEYARLFGVLPIGLLGAVGYTMILAAWLLGRLSEHRLARLANLSIRGMTTFGILFSIYLTFLEPFVIGATCAWCLTSSIVMAALFWLSLPMDKRANTSTRVAKSLRL